MRAVGVSNLTDFVRPRRSGRLDVVAPVHQGATQQLFQVEIRRPEDHKLAARGPGPVPERAGRRMSYWAEPRVKGNFRH